MGYSQSSSVLERFTVFNLSTSKVRNVKIILFYSVLLSTISFLVCLHIESLVFVIDDMNEIPFIFLLYGYMYLFIIHKYEPHLIITFFVNHVDFMLSNKQHTYLFSCSFTLISEHLTVRITLINPMRIPLVFTNVHLLWIFKLTNSITQSSSCTVNTIDPNIINNSSSHYHLRNNVNNDQVINITNEIPTHSNYSYPHHQQERQHEMINQFVSGETISEFIMLPGERKNVNFIIFSVISFNISCSFLNFNQLSILF